MPETLPPPMPLAMVICDAIWRDPSTGKETLLGLFSEIGARTFPATHPMFAVHVAMTDGHGTVPVKLQLVDAEEQHEPLFTAENDLVFPDRRAIVTLDVHMGGIVFPEPGEYRLQLFARGEFVIERRILVRDTNK